MGICSTRLAACAPGSTGHVTAAVRYDQDTLSPAHVASICCAYAALRHADPALLEALLGVPYSVKRDPQIVWRARRRAVLFSMPRVRARAQPLQPPLLRACMRGCQTVHDHLGQSITIWQPWLPDSPSPSGSHGCQTVHHHLAAITQGTGGSPGNRALGVPRKPNALFHVKKRVQYPRTPPLCQSRGGHDEQR
jgi:hypothetical protein